MREPVQDFTLSTDKKKSAWAEDIKFLDFSGDVKRDGLSKVDTMQGTMVISKVDHQRVGRVEYYSDRVLYYIKTQKHGYGPFVAHPFSYEVEAAYGDTDTRSKSFQYTRVSQDTFSLYLKFLRTRNEAYFNNLERIMKDGEDTL